MAYILNINKPIKINKMKVFIVMQTIIGNWLEDFKDSTNVQAVFSTKELAEAFLITCPSIVLSGWEQEPEYDEETGNQIGVHNSSLYETEAYYHIIESDVLTATMHK